jgi:hypothetical protein
LKYDQAMSTRTRRYIAFTLASLATLMCFCGLANAQTGTSVTVYQAFTSQGFVRLHTHSRSGDCPSGSEATPRRDAWRCFSGNLVLDPCFSSTHDHGIVVCPEAPWLKQAIEIHLTKPLVHKYGNHSAPSQSLQPWALELYDGRRCLFADGASNVVENQRLNYFCGSGSQEGLWGSANRSSAPWTILSAPFQATKLTESVAISHAWT